jgi:hypothetical protein
MTSWSEAITSGNTPPLGALLKAGDEFLSGNEQITFHQYNKAILPLDGWVFWVKDPGNITFTAKGSFHVAVETEQREDQSISVNELIFTSEVMINKLNSINSQTMWIADMGPVKFAFNSMKKHYRQADLWHYIGQAIYPNQRINIVDDPADLDLDNVIVSNSLPIWLYLNNYTPTLPTYGFGNSIPLYPSFLVPENIGAPYGSIHVEYGETFGLASAPYLDQNSSHFQLCSDKVKVVLWGIRNDAAHTFLDCVYQFSRDYDYIGLMNIPIVRDVRNDKEAQSEVMVVSQKKEIYFEVSYYQTTVRDIARQMLTNFVNTYQPRHVIHNPVGPQYPIIKDDPVTAVPWST